MRPAIRAPKLRQVRTATGPHPPPQASATRGGIECLDQRTAARSADGNVCGPHMQDRAGLRQRRNQARWPRASRWLLRDPGLPACVSPSSADTRQLAGGLAGHQHPQLRSCRAQGVGLGGGLPFRPRGTDMLQVRPAPCAGGCGVCPCHPRRCSIVRGLRTCPQSRRTWGSALRWKRQGDGGAYGEVHDRSEAQGSGRRPQQGVPGAKPRHPVAARGEGEHGRPHPQLSSAGLLVPQSPRHQTVAAAEPGPGLQGHGR